MHILTVIIVAPAQMPCGESSSMSQWDSSAIGALGRVEMKAQRHGHAIEVVAPNDPCAKMEKRFALHEAAVAISPLD